METQEPGFWRVVRSYIWGDINSGLPRERWKQVRSGEPVDLTGDHLSLLEAWQLHSVYQGVGRFLPLPQSREFGSWHSSSLGTRPFTLPLYHPSLPSLNLPSLLLGPRA